MSENIRILVSGADPQSEAVRAQTHFAEPVVLVDGEKIYAFQVRALSDYLFVLNMSLEANGFFTAPGMIVAPECTNAGIRTAAKNAYAQNPNFFKNNFAVDVVDLDKGDIPCFSKSGGRNPSLDAVIKHKERFFALDVHPHKYLTLEDDVVFDRDDEMLMNEIADILVEKDVLCDILPDGFVRLTELCEI